MSIEAMWTARFQSNKEGSGAGIVVLETERVFGGDSQYYYIGAYRVDGNQISIRLTVTHYANEMDSIFGPLPEFAVTLKGEMNEKEMNLKGQANQDDDLQIHLIMKRVAELP
ncbi:MAG: hypothetical protein ACYCXX_07250 [Acidiferrobacter thiooxydans]